MRSDRLVILKQIMSGGQYLVDLTIPSVINAKNKRPLKGSVSRDGYTLLHLSHAGKCYWYSLHEVVSYAIGLNLAEGVDINHIDGNKSNNLPENLEVVSRTENQLHAMRIGLRKYKLGAAKVAEIRTRYSNGERQSVLAIEYGVALSTISFAVRGVRWSKINHPSLPEYAETKKVSNCRINHCDASCIRDLRSQGIGINSLAAFFGIKPRTVYAIVSGKRWRY